MARATARLNEIPNPARIKVIGVGGGGCNAIIRMVEEQIQGVQFIGVNTDAQDLLKAEIVPIRIRIGDKLTHGLGVGGDHVLGLKAAEESHDELREVVSDADMVFIATGMGGGTGTGASPVIAELSKEMGALTVGIVTKPFSFEGGRRCTVAEEGITRLIDKVDTLIVIPNDRLLTLCDHKVLAENAFKLADDALRLAVQAITSVINIPGKINLDFADVKAIMKNAGPAWMSIGQGTGQNRAIDAARSAMASPLLDVSIEGAKGVLYTVTGGEDLTLFEIDEAAEIIKKTVDPEANIIFGVVYEPQMENEVRITLVATGFASKAGVPGPKDEEIRQLLRGLEDEAELDVPTFMRRPRPLRRRPVAAYGPSLVAHHS